VGGIVIPHYTTSMNKNDTAKQVRNFVVAACLSVAAIGAAGCDDSSSKPPASATGGGGGAGGNGNPINKLAESPTSLFGKSAATGRDVAKQAANAQAAELGTAQEITGEATGVTVSGLAWSPPAAWQSRAPSNNFRAAELVVAGDSGNGEAVAVFSTGIGGDAASNIERWRSQVVNAQGEPAPAELKKQTINGVKVTTVAMEGTLKGGNMGGPSKDQPNYAFRGAIVEGPTGTVFIKLTGPVGAVKPQDEAWNTMIAGVRKQ